MKWIKGEKRRLRTVISAVFALQLLVSSFCFITPASAAQPAVSKHCHEQVQMHHDHMPMSQPSHHTTGNGCAHCDTPQNINTVSHATDLTPAAMLLAVVIAHEEANVPLIASRFSVLHVQAPPDSSGILLTTTQRLRI